MNIVLLSGGSGKRLWPLSNEVRSKQFIKLLKNEDNSYESMVQRVYRQIMEVAPMAKVTLATSKMQVSAIRNQLGEQVDICVEPCRRDTFPAIVLAAAFLYYEKKIPLEEVIVVCPVDPYVENSYYDKIMNLVDLAENGDANITLMGIEPTYPSPKYGYIIPNGKEDVSTVQAFKEKPTIDIAKEYLERGALWNAGVFAFKLGYLIRKAKQTIDFIDYNDLYAKYSTLEKISFDYEIVEKESKIQVVRYSGAWRDIGTWNMMSEVMSDETKGNVMLDEFCHNTNVVNELNIPILCMGCNDMVIAASGDGILVSDKERSGYMKEYVDKISCDIMFAEKSWGTYTVLDAQPNSLIVRIVVKAGQHMSYHCHEHRDEMWTILGGKGVVVICDKKQEIKCGDVISIKRGQKHTIIADENIVLIEIQMGGEISVEDKMKYALK